MLYEKPGVKPKEKQKESIKYVFSFCASLLNNDDFAFIHQADLIVIKIVQKNSSRSFFNLHPL